MGSQQLTPRRRCAESAEKGTELVRTLPMHHRSIPALNNWTILSACAALLALRLPFPVGRSGDFTKVDEGTKLGQPIDQTKKWRKLALQG